MWPRARAFLPLLMVLALAGGCGADGSGPPVVTPEQDAGTPEETGPLIDPIVDLRADVNRDGMVDLADPTEDEGEATWTAERGAIFLANIDDDQEACPFTMGNQTLSDDEIAACHDAADTVVNGEADLEDLARLRIAPWPEAPAGAVGAVRVSSPGASRVRLFRRTAEGFKLMTSASALDAEALRRGAELAIEATDIVRDRADWDGTVDVTLAVSRRFQPETEVQDTVRLRVAPVVLFHHLTPARTVYVTKLYTDPISERFRWDLGTLLAGAASPVTLSEFQDRDRWAQDYFEPGYMTMPKPGGQHVIQVNYRAANVYFPTSEDGPLRPAGRVVFWLRGRDQAAVQQYQRDMSRDSQTLNSFGNTEVIPPYEKDGVKYPLGRLLRGTGPASRPDFRPDDSFTRLLDAQGMQPTVYVDTSWLSVSHVDEFVTFLPADTPRGWIALVADPALARRMLLDAEADGHGDVKLFSGLSSGGALAEQTISQVLEDASVMNASARAVVEIDSQLAVLKAETGLTDAEILRVPFLFVEDGAGVTAYQSGTVNLLSVSRTLVVAPDTHGPIIDGRDIFKAQLEEVLAPHGIHVHWQDVWDLFHLRNGEVHCGTHSARALPGVKWWETGR